MTEALPPTIQEPTAKFAGWVEDPRMGPRESDVGKLYNVFGTGKDDGTYFVEINYRGEHEKTRIFLSEARKLTNPLPEQDTQIFQRSAINLTRKRKNGLKPATPLYEALLAGVSAGASTSLSYAIL